MTTLTAAERRAMILENLGVCDEMIERAKNSRRRLLVLLSETNSEASSRRPVGARPLPRNVICFPGTAGRTEGLCHKASLSSSTNPGA